MNFRDVASDSTLGVGLEDLCGSNSKRCPVVFVTMTWHHLAQRSEYIHVALRRRQMKTARAGGCWKQREGKDREDAGPLGSINSVWIICMKSKDLNGWIKQAQKRAF